MTLGQSSPEILHASDGVLDSSKNGVPSAHILLSKQINNDYCDLRGGRLIGTEREGGGALLLLQC